MSSIRLLQLGVSAQHNFLVALASKRFRFAVNALGSRRSAHGARWCSPWSGAHVLTGSARGCPKVGEGWQLGSTR